MQFNFTEFEGDRPLSFQWDFGDNSGNSSERNPTHVFETVGNYTTVLSVVDINGDIDVNIKEDEQQTSQLIEAIKQHDLKNAIVKIVYYLPLGARDVVDLAAVQRACYGAHDLIGIIPVHQPKTRTTRATMKVDMSLKDLLTTYFENKPELKNKKEPLIKKALELQNELTQKELS